MVRALQYYSCYAHITSHLIIACVDVFIPPSTDLNIAVGKREIDLFAVCCVAN